MLVKTTYSQYEGCWIELGRYQADNSRAVTIKNWKDGSIATITVCLVNPTLGDELSFIDTNNCPWAPSFIEEYGLGTMTGFTQASGFCEYPLIRWNVEKLENAGRKE